MSEIKRDTYLKKLKGVVGTHDIKVITGMRRAGKSVILKQFVEYLKQEYSTANIVQIDFNIMEFKPLRDSVKLYEYIKKLHNPSVKNFLIIDEVQMCNGFEDTINSIYSEDLYEMYITGSNAFLMSSDLATLFTGRTFEISVYPFSFAEYIQYFNYEKTNEAFTKYMIEGGLSGSYPYVNESDKLNYIEEVFNTLIIRDIEERHEIRNKEVMNNVINYLIENASCMTSSRKIADYLSTAKQNTNHVTIGNYIDYLCNAFAFYKVKRYDIEGKKYLSTIDKYYLSDHAVRYAKLGLKNMNSGRTLENIVAVELLRRGYEVYVGTMRNAEVDFVATKRSEQLYIQVCDDMSKEATLLREVKSLLSIHDAFPKIILTRMNDKEYLYEGVHVINITDWLLKDTQ